MTDAVDALRRRIDARLHELLQRNARGVDVAPGDRLRLEGWMEAALSLAGDDAPALVAQWQSLLPARSRLQCERVDGCWCARLDIWQPRAPVRPSTRD